MTPTTIRAVIAGIALTIASAGVAAAQHRVTRADVNGEWQGALALGQGTHDMSLVFELTDLAFVGRVYDGGQLFSPMERGTLSGDTVKSYVDKLAFTGVIAVAKMKIALIVYNGSTRNFVATKRP